jgi:microcystin-dependent protein
MLDPYIGQIIPFAGNFAPKDWALCNGQLLNINQNTALFSILGTNYGGDGRTTFGLPDLRDRTALHTSNQFPLGTKAGNATKQLLANNLPAHTHTASATIKANTAGGNNVNPVGLYLANTGKGDPEFASSSNGTMAADSVLGVTVSTEGGSQPVNNMQPYLAVNFIIALTGVYPPRP